MDGIVPILAIVAIVTIESQEFQRFPSRKHATERYEIAKRYQSWLRQESEKAGALGWNLWAQYFEAQRRRDLWMALHGLAHADDIDKKREWAGLARSIMQDDPAFYRGEWPGPLPEWHFEKIGIVPAKKLGK